MSSIMPLMTMSSIMPFMTMSSIMPLMTMSSIMPLMTMSSIMPLMGGFLIMGFFVVYFTRSLPFYGWSHENLFLFDFISRFFFTFYCTLNNIILHVICEVVQTICQFNSSSTTSVLLVIYWGNHILSLKSYYLLHNQLVFFSTSHPYFQIK